MNALTAMKRSLKLHIFGHVMIVASVIVVSNRYLSQTLLHYQIENLMKEDMATALIRCDDVIGDESQFFACHRKISPGNMLNSLSEVYIFCPPASSASKPISNECKLANQKGTFWVRPTLLQQGLVELGSLTQDANVWYGVRRASLTDGQGAVLLINSKAADNSLNQLWSFRDRNLAFTLPVIVAMLMMLAVYLSYLLTRAVSSLESALAQMDEKNLSTANHFLPKYREFDKLVLVFEGLRMRLQESFAKARRFAADASHELRTPLTVLRGNTELMISDLPKGSTIRGQVSKINVEAERLIEITEKLLLLSRADASNMRLEKSVIDLSEFLKDLIDDEVDTLQTLKISSQIKPNVQWLCDASLIGQLIHNLYANAIKYNATNGWIRISLDTTSTQLYMTFQNSTTDISADLSHLAFERFYRGDAAHSRKIDGHGLGLSIAQEIALCHGGILTLTSHNGIVTVRFEAPLSSP
jgi:signal transduction histidine kinase